MSGSVAYGRPPTGGGHRPAISVDPGLADACAAAAKFVREGRDPTTFARRRVWYSAEKCAPRVLRRLLGAEDVAALHASARALADLGHAARNFKDATAECSRKQQALDVAARAMQHATQQLERAREAFDQASDEMVEAECKRLQAQAEVSKAPDKQQTGVIFQVDPNLFESLEELEENDRSALEAFQKQLDENEGLIRGLTEQLDRVHTQLLRCAQLKFEFSEKVVINMFTNRFCKVVYASIKDCHDAI